MHTVNNELKSAANWLSLNTAKTNYMLFSNSAGHLPGEVKINDSIIKKLIVVHFWDYLLIAG